MSQDITKGVEMIRNTTVPESEMSDMELLSLALEEALDAHGRGVIIGPAPSWAELERSMRRARKADTSRQLKVRGASEGAAA
ncbi:hypothetical protein AB0I53_11990 [Saccharopolyspora sp. NPDC050389]|uniref:hypothetical protein n=1 Tax=Saccharopolyspora sp. NPDC050389 TaxID=3155516 RepID=UPI0033C54F1F